jgi:hypothetical protein
MLRRGALAIVKLSRFDEAAASSTQTRSTENRAGFLFEVTPSSIGEQLAGAA